MRDTRIIYSLATVCRFGLKDLHDLKSMANIFPLRRNPTVFRPTSKSRSRSEDTSTDLLPLRLIVAKRTEVVLLQFRLSEIQCQLHL